MLPILLLSLALTAESPDPQVELKVSGFYATASEARLEIHASAPLLTLAEGGLDGILRSRPQLEWRCQFVNETSLGCETIPGQRLPLASPIVLEIAAGVLAAQDGRAVAGLDVSEETDRAELRALDLGLDARGLPLLLLYSEQELVPESIALELKQEARHWSLPVRAVSAQEALTLAAEADGNSLSEMQQLWRIDWPADLQPGLKTRLVSQPGLAMVGGLLATDREELVHEWLPPPQLEFQIECEFAGHEECWMESPQMLLVNTRPAPAVFAELARRLPRGMRLLQSEAKFQRRWLDGQSWAGFVWPIAVDRPGHRYRMRIPQHWRGALGQPAAEEFEFTSGKPRPKAWFAPALQLLPLGARAPATGLHWANEPELELFQRNVSGGAQWQWSQQALREPDPLRTTMLALAREPREMRQQGGTEWGAVVRTSALKDMDSDYWDPRIDSATYGRAWADVGLHALRIDGQLQLIATDLYSAEPLPEVAMELLQLQIPLTESQWTLKGNGLTGADGQVALKAFGVNRAHVVRARRGERFSVLPLHQLTTLERDEAERSWSSPEPNLVWSERLVYRPGETAQFRVMVREWRERKRVVPKAEERQRSFRLMAEETGTVLAEWQGELDEFGGHSGHWAIPAGARDGRVKLDVSDDDGDFDYAGGAVAFRIASIDPPALEVALELPEGAIRPESLPQLSLAASYFSGGPAAGVASRLVGVLKPGLEALQQGFPGFQFLSDPDAADNGAEKKLREAEAGCDDAHGLAGNSLAVAIDLAMGQTDARGRSSKQLELPMFRCALGELKLSPVVRAPGMPESYGQTVRRVFSREPLLLGLKVPQWQMAGESVELAAVLVRARDLQPEGRTRFELRIQFWDGKRWSEKQSCSLGEAPADLSCPWRPAQAGLWRVLASSEGVATLKRSIRVWGQADEQLAAHLSGPEMPVAAGTEVVYALRQPYPNARVLMTVESDGLLHQQWHTVTGTQAQIPLRIPAEWAPCMHVAVLVVPVTPRGAPLQRSLADAVQTCVATPRSELVELQVQTLVCSDTNLGSCQEDQAADGELSRTRPGSWVRLKLRSLHDQPLSLSLTAIDAAVLDLDPELRRQRDPHTGDFLRPTRAGSAATTYSLQAWAGASPATGEPVGGFDSGLDGSEELDRIEVTGSRILSAADAFSDSNPAKGRRPDAVAGGEVPDLAPRWRKLLRSRFAESAYWRPAERLEAGATRTFEFKLPDNLTRWHVEVLAVDAAEHFQQVEAELEAGLPLEARILAPARLYAGDVSVLGAELRNAGATGRRVIADLELAGTRSSASRTLDLSSNSSQRLDLNWTATSPGTYPLLARVEDLNDGAADALLRPLLVQSRYAPWTQRQTGLLLTPSTHVDLARVLVPGTTAKLSLRLSRNPLFALQGLFEQMRDYPHRCLEQRLSRALVAHQARALGGLTGGAVDWATPAVINEPMDQLRRYVDEQDELVYFNPAYERPDSNLASYALLVFAELGQRMPVAIHERAVSTARAAFKRVARNDHERRSLADGAALALHALARLELVETSEFETTLQQQELLSPWGRSQLVQALAKQQDYREQQAQQLLKLRALGRRDGPRIRLIEGEGWGWLGSMNRDSCAVLHALVVADQGADAHAQQSAWLYGIFDAYGSQLPYWDTQAMVSCSSAASAYAKRWLLAAKPVAVAVSADGQSLLQDTVAAERSQLLERSLGSAERPTVEINGPTDKDLSFDLSLTQQRDLLSLPAASQGLSLTRTAEVWRDQQWLPLTQAKPRVGEWLRVRLLVESASRQSMVALSDTVPGGLRAIDKKLEGVSDAQIQAADEGSFWFFERQLSTTHARFYATELPGGRQEVIYYAQARHAGRYAWPGATVELMYALQRYGRSAAQVLEIE